MAELDTKMLLELGWEEGASGTFIVPKGNETISWVASNPSFPSARAAIEHIQQNSPAMALPLAEQVFDGLSRHAKKALRELKWKATLCFPEQSSGQSNGDAYPPRVEMVMVPPHSKFTDARSDQGLVDGQDFFSDRTLIELLLDVAEGSRVVPFLTAEQATQVIQVKAFKPLLDQRYALWPAEWEVDSHPQPEFIRGFPSIDELEITTTPMGTEEGINLWTSKRAFLRAVLGCVNRRGFGLIPVGDVSGKESDTALWLKIMSPRHKWTWRYAADGRPIFCPPGADEQGKAGTDFFTSMEGVRGYLIGFSRANKSAARPPMSPTLRVAAPSKPSVSIVTAPKGAASGAASSKPAAASEKAFKPDSLDCTTGEHAIAVSDSWAETWQRLTKLGWGHERPHTPGRHGAATDRYYFPGVDARGELATEGVHFLTSSKAVMDFIRAHYTLLPSREPTTSGSKERDDGKAKRKAEEEEKEEEKAEPSSKALKATGGRKASPSTGGGGGEGKREDAMEVVEEENPKAAEKSKKPVKGDNPYDDPETYEDLQVNDGRLVQILRDRYNWHYRFTLLGTLYIRRKKGPGESDATWRKGTDYFEDEGEIRNYLLEKQAEATKARAQAEKKSQEEQQKRKREARAEKQASKPADNKPAGKGKQAEKSAGKPKQEEPAAAAEEEEEQQQEEEEVHVVEEKKAKSKRRSSMASDMEAEVKKEPEVRTQSGRVIRRASHENIFPHTWNEIEKFPDEPAKGDSLKRHVLAREINIWQKGTYAWAELKKWLGWKSISHRGTQRTESGYIYLYPGGDPDGEEGKDWFGTADAIRDWAREQVKNGKQLPIDPKIEAKNILDAAAAKSRTNKKTGQAKKEEEEEEEASEKKASDDDASEGVEGDEPECFRADDSEAELIRKMKQRGFRELSLKGTQYLAAEGVEIKRQRDLDKLKEGSDYLLASAEAIKAWACEQEGEESSDEEEEQEEGEEEQEEEEEEAAQKRRKTQPRPLDPTILPGDFHDFQGLINKLRKFHGWKTVNGRGLQSTVHIPPGGKGPTGKLNVDYCETEEQVKSMIFKHHGREADEMNLSQEDLPLNASVSAAYKRPAFATSAEQADGDDDDALDEDLMQVDEADGEADEDVQHKADAMQVDPPQEAVKRAAKAEVSFTFHGKQPKAGAALKPMSHYDRAYLLQQLNREDQEEGGSIENLNLALRMTHGWTVDRANTLVVPSQGILDSHFIYTLPGRPTPAKGGKEGRDWIGTWDGLRRCLEGGYGLKPYHGATMEEITYPPEHVIDLLKSPACERRTRSGNTLDSGNSSAPRARKLGSSPTLSDPFSPSGSDKGSATKSVVSTSGGVRSRKSKGARALDSLDEEVPSSQESDIVAPAPAPTRSVAKATRKMARLPCASPDVPVSGTGPALVTPGSAGSVPSQRGRLHPTQPLTSDQRARYTAAVLHSKGYRLQQVGTDIKLFTIVAPEPPTSGSMDQPGLRFDSREEALRHARDTQGLVSEEELFDMYSKDPWRPVLDKLLSTRERMGQCRCPGVRSKETDVVTKFLLDKALQPTGGVIYLCGLPGTGKTEVAQAAIHKMNATIRERGMTRVPKAGVLSCSTFKQDPESLWEAAYRKLNSISYQHGEGDQADMRRLNLETAQSYLQRKQKPAWVGGIAKALAQSSSARIEEADTGRCDSIMGNMKVLVLDEIDLLLGTASGNKLLSELFRHALSPNSTLLLIAIANTVTDRIDTGLTLSSAERAGIPPSVVFEAFGADDLTMILKSEVNGAISDVGIKKLATSVYTRAGDARKAVGFAKDAIDRHRKQLEERASADEGMKASAEEVAKLSVVPMGVVMAVSGDDIDPATTIKELPLYARLLLAVLLEETKDGHVVRWSDLKSQYVDAVSQKLAGTCGNNVFENNMQVLLEYSLAAVHKGRGRQTHDASVTAMISIDDYLKHVTTGDNQLFDRYVASIRRSHKAKQVQGTG